MRRSTAMLDCTESKFILEDSEFFVKDWRNVLPRSFTDANGCSCNAIVWYLVAQKFVIQNVENFWAEMNVVTAQIYHFKTS